MYLIRRAKSEDLDQLFKLAKMVFFINLPADKDIIAEKIRRSSASFEAAALGRPPRFAEEGKGAVKNSPLYMFVLEDRDSGNCLGTSMIIARMGAKGHPNLSFELQRKEFFSRDLQAGHTHVTAKLCLDESGPTEIGGLILSPTVRRHPQKLGKQISLVRFHYMGLHRNLISDHVLAEMMAPLTPDGRSPFWEALGRQFINLSYEDADLFCQHSREFMLSLLPREEIYLTLLPPDARQVVGQVGLDTKPARRMLEGIGFKYNNRIDPFDGGPHLEARTDEIPLVSATRRARFAGVCTAAQAKTAAFVSAEAEDGDFRAMYTKCSLGDGGKTVRFTKEVAAALGAEEAVRFGVTAFDLHRSDAPAADPTATITPAQRRRTVRV